MNTPYQKIILLVLVILLLIGLVMTSNVSVAKPCPPHNKHCAKATATIYHPLPPTAATKVTPKPTAMATPQPTHIPTSSGNTSFCMIEPWFCGLATQPVILSSDATPSLRR